MPDEELAPAPLPEVPEIPQEPAVDGFEEALALRKEAVAALKTIYDRIPELPGDRFAGGLRSDLNHCVALLSLRV
jgi:hypothetical protein